MGRCFSHCVYSSAECGPPLAEASGRSGLRDLSPFIRNLCAVFVSLRPRCGPTAGRPQRCGVQGRDEGRARCVREMGGTLGWPRYRDFGVNEPRAEPGRQGMKKMRFTILPKSLHHILLCGVTGLRWGSARCGFILQPPCRHKKLPKKLPQPPCGLTPVTLISLHLMKPTLKSQSLQANSLN